MWFADERCVERRMKVSWHPERRLFVLSLWHGDVCTATFRLPLGEVPRLVGTLVDALSRTASAPGQGPGSATAPRRGAAADTETVTRQIVGRARAWSRAVPDRWRPRVPRS